MGRISMTVGELEGGCNNPRKTVRSVCQSFNINLITKTHTTYIPQYNITEDQ
jgi:hypothetical protein